jgi:hypothetical protein
MRCAVGDGGSAAVGAVGEGPGDDASAAGARFRVQESLVHDRKPLMGEGCFFGYQATHEMEGSFDGTSSAKKSSPPQKREEGEAVV